MKKFLLTLVAVLGLATVGLNLSAQPASAQKIHQMIPESYWGTWKFKSEKVVIYPHEVKTPTMDLKSKKLGVHVGKHKKFVSVFEVYKGKQASASYMMKRTKHHKKTALRANFDGNTQYYLRKGWY